MPLFSVSCVSIVSSFQIMGVNKKYDCFDCQKNTFSVAQVREAFCVALCCVCTTARSGRLSIWLSIKHMS